MLLRWIPVALGFEPGERRNQLGAGLVPPNDVLNVESQASRQRTLAIQARGARDVSEAELGRLIGAAPDAAIEPAVTLAPPEATTLAADALVELAAANS